MNNTQISVIIPAYNAERTIRKALQAIQNQVGDLKAEIIVVDDGSTDDTRKIVSEMPDVKLLQQENSGPAAARNTGARAARGDILVFTDSDTVPHHDWLQNLTNPFLDQAIMATAGTYTIANKEKKLAQLIQKEIEIRHSSYKDYIIFAGTYNLAIRKEVFVMINGFDESYKHASGEDNDLCYRIAKLGHKIKYIACAKVAHHHPEELLNYLKTQFRHGFWRVKLYLSHPTQLTGDSYTGAFDAAETILCLLFPFAFLVSISSKKSLFIKTAALILSLVAVGFEFLHGLTVGAGINQVVYAAAVFSLRAIFRTVGLLSGILYFCSKFHKVK